MPIRTALWKIGSQPLQLVESLLAKEQLLEDMVVAAPRMLSDEWMLIGRQEDTGFGGRIDLLAIAPDGSLVLIELKRDRTPRDVVAQALDYASWVESLQPEDSAAIYSRFAPGKNLADDFSHHFGQPLNDEGLNQTHQIIIVASALDDSTERIVGYLSERGISINVLCFQVFANGTEQILSRSWLLDPVRTTSTVVVPDGKNEPWNGEFYCSYGHSAERSWEDAVEFGFISGGGGSWYSKTLQLLNLGDRVWVKAPGYGFVGVGRVIGRSQPASTFKVTTADGDVPVLDVVKHGNYHREYASDPECSEYFVPIKWLQTVSVEKAINEIGLFGNQNTICKPTVPKWRSTVDRLKEKFSQFDLPSI
jgi:hypothetical protein